MEIGSLSFANSCHNLQNSLSLFLHVCVYEWFSCHTGSLSDTYHNMSLSNLIQRTNLNVSSPYPSCIELGLSFSSTIVFSFSYLHLYAQKALNSHCTFILLYN